MSHLHFHLMAGTSVFPPHFGGVCVCVKHLNRCKTSIRFATFRCRFFLPVISFVCTFILSVYARDFFVHVSRGARADRWRLSVPTKLRNLCWKQNSDRQFCVPAFFSSNGQELSQEPYITQFLFWLNCIVAAIWTGYFGGLSDRGTT